VVKWNISTTLGTYVIPWTTASGVKMPLTIAKTTAGTGAGTFVLSTWKTVAANTPWPTAVTNMFSVNGLASPTQEYYVIDRFWHVDAQIYTAKPNVTFTFAYDPVEYAAPNTIIEANLQAQRFNTGTSNWEGGSFGGNKLFGTDVPASNYVNAAVILAADFFKDWTLVDKTNPLPVTLTDFTATCTNEGTLIAWTTDSEINNDYFVVQKSYDAVNYFDLETKQGAGNSNAVHNYSVIDNATSNGNVYYRLKQVDFDGSTTYHNVIASNCAKNNFDVSNITFTDNQVSFNITSTYNEAMQVYVYDYRGRKIADKSIVVKEGINPISLSNLKISTGIYMLSIIGNKDSFSTKLWKNH